MTEENDNAEITQQEQVQARKRRGPLVIAVVLVVALLTGSVYYKFVMPPADYSGPATGTVVIHINQGDSVAVIGNTLKESGVISSVDRFISAANNNPASNAIQSGTFKLGQHIPAAQALSELLDLHNKVIDGIVIPEGLRASEIIRILSLKSNIPATAFTAALASPQKLGLPAWANNNPEGFLFPATYEFSKTATAESILTTMIAKSVSEYSTFGLPTMCKNISACNGLTALQVVTGASIMQAEVHPRDFHKVARVILNRINEPMRLQMDSTVAYGRNKKQVMLSDADLKTDTPYNTYLHDGLPPGPISNPGVEAVDAMLHPDSGNWLYFITVDLNTQETKFTHSYQEFLTFKDEFMSFCRSNPGSC